jgi:hypothetical protein
MSPSFNDFRRDQNIGERTHPQRLLTYGTLAAIFLVVTLITWTGIWDVTDDPKGMLVLVAAPCAGALATWQFIAELRAGRKP